MFGSILEATDVALSKTILLLKDIKFYWEKQASKQLKYIASATAQVSSKLSQSTAGKEVNQGDLPVRGSSSVSLHLPFQGRLKLSLFKYVIPK